VGVGIGVKYGAMKAVFEWFEVDALVNKRRSFESLRWAFWLGLCGGVLSAFFGGIAPVGLLLWCVPLAVGLLVLLLKSWRTEDSVGWEMLAVLLFVLGPRMLGLHEDEVPLGHFLQWLFGLLMLVGAPLWFWRGFFYEMARLEREPGVSSGIGGVGGDVS
jgi:hypothetical protein